MVGTGSEDTVTVTPHFYRRDRDCYLPSEFAVSPWNPSLQNGVALAGLCAHLLQQVSTPGPMLNARLTVDILRGVPRQALSFATTILRQGRQLQLLETSLLVDGECHVRATCLRVREGASPTRLEELKHPFPILSEARIDRSSRWVESINIAGGFQVPGPGARWIRFPGTVVEGSALSPFEAIAMLADFGSGIGPLCSPAEWAFANVDITLYLARMPRDEWVLVDSATESAGNGVGIAQTRLGDRFGMIGTAHQTLFINARG